MATFLSVSVDELIGYQPQNKTAPSISDEADSDADPLRSTLLHNFDQLNQEGQEKLVDTSDDMVSSGKYTKSDPAGLGKKT